MKIGIGKNVFQELNFKRIDFRSFHYLVLIQKLIIMSIIVTIF